MIGQTVDPAFPKIPPSRHSSSMTHLAKSELVRYIHDIVLAEVSKMTIEWVVEICESDALLDDLKAKVVTWLQERRGNTS